METQKNFNNDVNGGGTHGEASSSGSEFVRDGQTLGRYQATGSQRSNQRRRWTKADNIRAITSFYKSNPNAIGYRQRMHCICFEDGGFEITEQNLADQVRRIRKKEIITRVEGEEIERKLKEENRPATAEETLSVVENIEQNTRTTEVRTEMASETPLISTNESNHQNLEDNNNVLLSSLKEIIQNNEKQMTPALRSYDNKKLKDVTKRVNDVLGTIETNSISETKNLIIAGITLMYKELGKKTMHRKQKPKSLTGKGG